MQVPHARLSLLHEGICVKVLRFITLLLAALTVILAQFLVSSVQLISILPAWLLDLLPGLRLLSFWSAGNLQVLALLLATGGALCFGLLVQPWDPSPTQIYRTTYPRTVRTGVLLVWLALIIAIVLTFVNWRSDVEPFWMLPGWIVSLILVLTGTRLSSARRAQMDPAPALPVSRPEAGWPLILLILIGVGLLVGWQLTMVPVAVSDPVVQHGIQAKALVEGTENRVFAPGWGNLPLLAFYPSALGISLSADTLLGSRLAGLVSALLTVLGVWLLGCELFRRQPSTIVDADQIEYSIQDDGRSTALWAAVVTGIGYTFIHFGRQPLFLEPVAWGTLSLWALHRGLRTHNRFVLATSGLLLGLTLHLYLTGWIFLVVAISWLCWIAVGRPHWFETGQDGVGWAGIGVWWAAIYVFSAPTIGTWLRTPDLLWQRFEAVSLFNPAALARMESIYAVQGLPALVWESLRRTLLTFNLYPDTSAIFKYSGPFFEPLVGALFLLGIGVIILNLDRLLSWLLLTWLGLVLILGGALTVDSPFWPRLLPVLPVAGLIAALSVERWRATLLSIGGPWLRHVGSVMVVGIVLLAATHNWVGYYESQTVLDRSPAGVVSTSTAATQIGRALRILAPNQSPFLVVGEGRPDWREPRIEYLGGRAFDRLPHGELTMGSLPSSLPQRSAILLLPEDQGLAATLETTFPGGRYRIQRNRLGNPVMVIYELP